jgi:antitoxin component of MazEF toxin-antitoxin module
MSRYILNLAGKRQLTLPPKLVKLLQLQTGDQIEIQLRGPNDIRLIPYARVRKDILTPEIEEILREREQAIDAGNDLISLEDLDRAVRAKESRVRTAVVVNARTSPKAKIQKRELSAVK